MPWILLSAIFIYSSASLATEKNGLEILVTSPAFHSEEITLSSAKDWLALYESSDGFELITVDLQIETTFNAVGDENGANPADKSVKVISTRKEPPILLIRDATTSTVRAGKIIGRLFDSIEGSLFPGQTTSIEIKGNYSQVEAFGSVSLDTKSNSPIMQNYEIFLTHREGRQSLLKQLELRPPEYRQRLLWAGDLDQDGRPDLLLDISGHYNEMRRALFLSSVARAPELVRKVAEFVSTGC